MTYLLDTNVCIDVLRGRADVIDRLRLQSPDDCVVSSVSVFELISGVLGSADPSLEAAKVRLFVNTLVCEPFSEIAADRAAQVRHDLDRRGQRIGAYDTLLAGHALALGVTCVTNNTAEFSRVQGLTLEDWRQAPDSPTP